MKHDSTFGVAGALKENDREPTTDEFMAWLNQLAQAIGPAMYVSTTQGPQPQIRLIATDKLMTLYRHTHGVAEPLPPMPEALVMVRDTDDEPEDGGWIVDCDCEGPLSYTLEAGEALYTADQMREYALAALGVDVPATGEKP